MATAAFALLADYLYTKVTGRPLIQWDTFPDSAAPWKTSVRYIPTKTTKVGHGIVEPPTATVSEGRDVSSQLQLLQPLAVVLLLALLMVGALVVARRAAIAIRRSSWGVRAAGTAASDHAAVRGIDDDDDDRSLAVARQAEDVARLERALAATDRLAFDSEAELVETGWRYVELARKLSTSQDEQRQLAARVQELQTQLRG